MSDGALLALGRSIVRRDIHAHGRAVSLDASEVRYAW